MKVTYASNKLERTCTRERELRKRVPKDWKKVQLRIKALERAAGTEDLKETDPLGRWHALTGDRDGQWAGTVRANFRIIFIPLGDDELLVAEIQSIYEDYH